MELEEPSERYDPRADGFNANPGCRATNQTSEGHRIAENSHRVRPRGLPRVLVDEVDAPIQGEARL